MRLLSPNLTLAIRLACIVLMLGTAQAAPRTFLGIGGDYGGLIEGTAGSAPDENGIFRMQLTDRGALTVRFVWKGRSYVGRSVFGDLESQLTFPVRRPEQPGDSFEISLSIAPQPGIINATLAEVTSGITGPPFLFTLTGEKPDAEAADRIGAKRVGWVTSPGFSNVGFMKVTVGATGRRAGRFVGRLPDYEPFSAGAPLRGNEFFLRSVLYRSRSGAGGQLLGRVLSDPGPGMEFTGQFLWDKKQNAASRAYPGGFQLTANVFQSVTCPPPAQLLPLGVTLGSANALLELSDGNLPMPVSAPLTVTARSVQVAGGQNPLRIAIRFVVPGSSFSGSFTHPVTGLRVPFAGVFGLDAAIGGSGKGQGCFLGVQRDDAMQSRSGAITITSTTPAGP